MKFRWNRLLAAMALLLSVLPMGEVHAQLSSCNVSTSPNNIALNTDFDANFGLYNPNSDPIQWIQITAPPGNLVALESASAYGWNADVTSDTVTFSGSSLLSTYSQGFDVESLSSSTAAGPANWAVAISDQTDGSNAFTCDDSQLGLTVAPQPSVINISNVALANIASTSVDVTWDTDTASTSQVSYGPDSSYGSNSTIDENLVTSHDVTLTGLTPNSGYHFAVTSTTPADGGTASSGDNTFMTAVYQPPVVTYLNPSTVIVNVPQVVIGSGPHTSVPPTASITTSLALPFKHPPTISGVASDSVAVARVEYSTDGGVDWLPVDQVTGGPANVSFSFTPVLQEDGNYKIVVRAIDTSGNIGLSAPETLILNTMPPQVGAALLNVGPNVITPDSHGVMAVSAGAEESVTVSALGGPTSVVLSASQLYGRGKLQTFTLDESIDTGLWSGLVDFAKAGAYKVVANSVDGAGTRVSQQLFTVLADAAPTVVSSGSGSVITGAKVSVYVHDPVADTWQLWDGSTYSQQNPQVVGDSGAYHLMVPEGDYYLKAQAPGYNDLVSQIFHVSRPTPIDTTLSMHAGGLKLFGLFPDRVSVVLGANKLIAAPSGIGIGQTPALFSLTTLSGATIRSIDLTGKPTVLTALAIWHPSTSEQLPALAALQKDTDINVLPVAVQERPGEVSVYLERAGSSLNIAPDPTGVFTASLGPSNVPTHYFLDREGVVRRIVVGVLSPAQILSDLEGL